MNKRLGIFAALAALAMRDVPKIKLPPLVKVPESNSRAARIIAESRHQQFLKGQRRQSQYNRTMAGLGR